MTAYTPNLPALITALPGDATRAPQTEFDRARQVLFLENLSVTGSVRSAASAAQVSHQTAYRARRATAAFRTAWDAALVVARANAADVLACRAIDGVEEKVFYHGEEIATRTRYSDRLLLAHLARLDRLAETPAASAFAENWDAALGRFEAGDPHPETAPEKISPGPCNTRSKSYTPDERDEDEEGREEIGEDGVDWEDEAAAEAEIARIEAAMAADRPADAPRLDAHDPHGPVADAQWEAFARGVPRWWLVVPPVPLRGPDGGEGQWHYAQVEAPAADEPPLPTAGDCHAASGLGPDPEAAPDVTPEPETEPDEAPVDRVPARRPAPQVRLV